MFIKEANDAYYATVDWALDISEIETRDFSIRGIPWEKIRINPETQAVVTRDSLRVTDYRKLPLPQTYFGTAMETIAMLKLDYVLLVAGILGKNYTQEIECIKLLRESGIAVAANDHIGK